MIRRSPRKPTPPASTARGKAGIGTKPRLCGERGARGTAGQGRARVKPRSQRELVCEHCGKVCLKRSGHARFCSDRCKWAAKTRRHSVKAICEGCGKEHIHTNGRNAGGRRFCSPRCYYSWIKGKRIAASRQATLHFYRLPVRVCEQCHAEYKPTTRRLGVKFCSLKCHNLNQKAKSRVTSKCVGCGAEICRPVTTRNAHRRRFCTTDCFRAHNIGSRNPLWRGERRLERGPTWRRSSRAARERDGNKCVCCGRLSERRQKVSVDHIVAYRLVKEYSPQLGIDPNDLRNLVSLCRGCHAKKTNVAERRLLAGDIAGFIMEAKKIIPLERLTEALELWGLSRRHHGTVQWTEKGE